MSFIFGGVRGREDPELAAGNRRSAAHFARDIGDDRALADDRPTIRRGNHWAWLAAAVVVLAVLGFTSSRGADEVELAANCTTPAVAVSSSQLTRGQTFYVRLAGPDGTDYVVTVDGEPVRGSAGSTVTYTETPAGPALRLTQCLSPGLALAAPAGEGPHRVAVLELALDGTTTEVAATTVQVTD
ncbi:hypothetical protein SAMN03159343_1576 [Klenkia marina]|uniref:Uncharacterized protein n=1 Tax=Klenkia marina TaxID=1960309 RepID=A0A1G4XW23_9ACTN|nr:hypothetical protein [Klenkia marina]SCX45369.1 hypothetical protein SAMN03159343_1576 [Klenkia marina]